MRSLTKQIALCTFGMLFEWYDFSLFAALTPIISEIFFPHSSHFAAMMSTFVVFASGFIMRPIGAIFFGHLGDKIGRKSTAAIGLIPIGLSLSTLLLVIFRLMQGFAASGEYPGGITLLAEQPNINKRGFISSFGIFAAPAGIFVGTVVCMVISKLIDHHSMLQWGWRIPFLIGAPLGLIGYLIRKTLLESEEFQIVRQKKILMKVPVLHLIKEYRGEFMALFCLYILSNVSFYINFIYLSSYSVNANKFGTDSALYLNSLTTFIYATSIVLFGLFSDYLGRKLLMIVACLLMAFLMYPLFLFILNGDIVNQFAAQSLISMMIGMFVGPLAILSADLFPTQVRYTGISMSLNISAAIFGGTTPLICLWLAKILNSAFAACYYFILVAVLALIAITLVKPKKYARVFT
jgi:MFS transporter, MHS family, proline/betaine transporter